MIAFLSVALVMALLTLVLLTRPLWRRRPQRNDSSQQVREQLQQVEALRASGALGDAQAAQARATLQQRIAESEPSANTTVGTSRALLPTLALFVLAVLVGGYTWLGAPQALDPTARVARDDGHSITMEQIQAMAEKLAARLKDKPDDAQGWAMLGRSYG